MVVKFPVQNTDKITYPLILLREKDNRVRAETMRIIIMLALNSVGACCASGRRRAHGVRLVYDEDEHRLWEVDSMEGKSWMSRRSCER